MKLLIIFFSTIITLSTVAQDIPQIKFNSDFLNWEEYNEIDSLDASRQDFILVQTPVIIDDNKLLTVSNLNNFKKEGFLINLRDIDSGEVIWQIIEHSEEKLSRKNINNFLIKEDTLEVYIIEEGLNIENPTQNAWNLGHVGLLKIDLSTGNINEKITTDHFNPNNFVHRTNDLGGKAIFNYDVEEFKKIDTRYLLNSRMNDSTILLSSITTFDKNGEFMKSDSTLFAFPYVELENFTRPWYDHNKNYSYATGGKMLNDSLFGFVIFTDNFNDIDTLHITKYVQSRPEEQYFYPFMYNKDKFSFAISTRWVWENEFSGTTYIIAKDGNLLNSKSISFIPNDPDDGYTFITGNVDFIDNKIFYTKKYDSEDYLHIDLLGFDELGLCNTIAAMKTPREDFSVFNVYAPYVGNNKFLINIRHRVIGFPSDTFLAALPIFTYLGLFDLNKVVSNKEEHWNINMNTYPNPVSDKLYIETDEVFTSWRIFSSAGLQLLSGKNTNNAINVTSLPSGIYVFQVSNKESTKSFKIVKN